MARLQRRFMGFTLTLEEDVYSESSGVFYEGSGRAGGQDTGWEVRAPWARGVADRRGGQGDEPHTYEGIILPRPGCLWRPRLCLSLRMSVDGFEFSARVLKVHEFCGRCDWGAGMACAPIHLRSDAGAAVAGTLAGLFAEMHACRCELIITKGPWKELLFPPNSTIVSTRRCAKHASACEHLWSVCPLRASPSPPTHRSDERCGDTRFPVKLGPSSLPGPLLGIFRGIGQGLSQPQRDGEGPCVTLGPVDTRFP